MSDKIVTVEIYKDGEVQFKFETTISSAEEIKKSFRDVKGVYISFDRQPIWQGILDVAYDRWQAHDRVVEEYGNKAYARHLAESKETDEYMKRAEASDLTQREIRSLQLVGALDKRWSLCEFFAQLSPREHLATVLGKFNQQVCNGGFSQWNYNGYQKASGGKTWKYLTAVGTPSALKAAELVKLWSQSRSKSHSDYLSDRYYEINSELEDEIEDFLTENDTDERVKAKLKEVR